MCWCNVHFTLIIVSLVLAGHVTIYFGGYAFVLLYFSNFSESHNTLTDVTLNRIRAFMSTVFNLAAQNQILQIQYGVPRDWVIPALVSTTDL